MNEAPAMPRRRSRWLTVGLPVGAGVALIAGAAVAVHAVAASIGPARHAADEYGAAISNGRFDDAQAMLCASDRSRVAATDLARHYRGLGVSGYSVASIDITDINGRSTGTATLMLNSNDALGDQITLPLVEEAGQWHPCPVVS